MSPSDPRDLLEEQIAFYRADAASYEAWRVEVFEHGSGGDRGARQRSDEARVLAALERFAPRGSVLELAAGTGRYTPALLASAERVTAVDASPESLRIARAKLARDLQVGRLTLVEADLFRWRPSRRHECVFFAYWLSHVPPDRLEGFWRLVDQALVPGGRVFFVDSVGKARASSPSSGKATYREHDDPGRGLSVRELDGRQYHVVKLVREPGELEAELHALGWRASVERGELSLWGSAVRSEEG